LFEEFVKIVYIHIHDVLDIRMMNISLSNTYRDEMALCLVKKYKFGARMK
jgi:hypothetical protein